MSALAVQAAGDSSLSIRVTRKNGDVEEYTGIPVEINEEQRELLVEYNNLINRAREIESQLFGYPISGE